MSWPNPWSTSPPTLGLERDQMAPYPWPAPTRAIATSSAPAGGLSRPAPAKAEWRELAEILVMTLLIAGGIQLTVQSRLVEGMSMEPTLHDQQRLLINRLAYLGSAEPQRGDIVVFHAWGSDEDFIKRVIALPGDTIDIHERQVRVNGSVLDEPYLGGEVDYGFVGTVTLGPDEYYVMGDNRGNSSDSRIHGPLPRSRIVGKAWLSYWPRASLGRVSDSAAYAAQ